MTRNPIPLVAALNAVAGTFTFHNSNPDLSPKHRELHASPLYNGLPPEGTDPLALGFYATQEIIDPVELEIEGNIPSWVSGSLYRGAQGTWDVGNFTSEHWFDGFSRQHRFEIKDGKVFYRSRNGSDEVQDCECFCNFLPLDVNRAHITQSFVRPDYTPAEVLATTRARQFSVPSKRRSEIRAATRVTATRTV